MQYIKWMRRLPLTNSPALHLRNSVRQGIILAHHGVLQRELFISSDAQHSNAMSIAALTFSVTGSESV